MTMPTMLGAETVAPDTTSLSSFLPVADLGVLAVNAFVIHAEQPILVHTGAAALRQPFLAALADAIDPSDLRYIFLSHMDADHLGNLDAVLALAPQAKVLTNFLGMAKMMLQERDLSRVSLIEPGSEIDLGDRRLVPLKPPYYDAPETTGFFDTKSRVLFSADAFGALLESRPRPKPPRSRLTPSATACWVGRRSTRRGSRPPMAASSAASSATSSGWTPRRSSPATSRLPAA